MTADTSDVEGAIDEVTGDVEVGVDADTSDAEAAIDGIEAPPIEQEVTVDTSGAEEQISGLGDSLSGIVGGGGGATSALDAFSGAALGAGSAGSIAATGGLAAVAAGFGFAVSEAGEAQVVLGATEALLTRTGAGAYLTAQQMSDLAGEVQGYAGQSDEAVLSGQNMLLGMRNVSSEAAVLNDVYSRTVHLGADVATRTGDVTSAISDLGRAVDNPVAGLARLRRAKILLTDAEVAQITSLQESGDLLGAQQALLDAVESRVGGLAETYGGEFTGGVDRAKEAVGEMAEEFGASLLPALEAVSESVIDQIARLNSWDQALNGALLSGPVQAILETLNGEIDYHGQVVGELPAALGGAAAAERDFAAAQSAAQEAIAATLPSLSEVVGGVDRAGQAFGVLNASSDPQVVIANLQNALFAWDVFKQRIATIAELGPNIAGALAELGPQVGGGLTSALVDAVHQGNVGVIGELDALILGVAERGGDVSAVMTGFAQNGMDGAVAAVQSSTGPMGAAGTAAGASGAAGIDAGLTYTNAAAIGAITGTQYGAGVSSGISGMYATVNAVATNVIAGAGNIGAAYSRGQALGSAYGSGIVAGLSGQIGNAVATRASLDAVVERAGREVGASGKASLAPVPVVHQTILDGQVLTETVNEVNFRGAIAEGYEQ